MRRKTHQEFIVDIEKKNPNKRKNNYARENGVNLLEIWHTDFDNIFAILDKFINLDLERGSY